jgi:outer membrane immunogenic protein
MRFVAALLVSTALGIVVANAADLPVKAPRLAAPAAVSWTGFYVGAEVGGGWSREQTTLVSATLFPVGFVDSPLQKSGVLGGVYGGYNYQFAPNLLVGIDGEYLAASVKGTSTDISPTTGGSTTTSTKMKWLADVSSRLGYTQNDWMVFGKAGWAWARFNTDAASFTGLGAPTSTSTATDTRNGWLVGAGLEWAFASHWSAKLEYDYVKFNTSNYNNTQTLTGGAVSLVPRSVTTDLHMAKVGLAYRF